MKKVDYLDLVYVRAKMDFICRELSKYCEKRGNCLAWGLLNAQEERKRGEWSTTDELESIMALLADFYVTLDDMTGFYKQQDEHQ